MIEQPPEHRSRSRRASRNWTVAPAVDTKSDKPLVYFKYGPVEHYIPHGAAEHIIEAMQNAMSDDTTTTYNKPQGRIL